MTGKAKHRANILSRLGMRIIGIDIGGTKTRGVLWDGKRVVRAREFPTPRNRSDFERRVLALSQRLAGEERVAAIGIGAAGTVERTRFISGPNIPRIKDFDFRALWPRSVALKVDNDARCFARAEFLLGGGRGSKSLFVLTIGTGVGRSYGKNGKIIKIKRFEYPEWWERRYQAIRDRRDDEKLIEFLAQTLAPLITPFKPEVIVIGGGVIERRGFWQRLQAAFGAHGLTCNIRRATLDRDAAAIGAALLFGE